MKNKILLIAKSFQTVFSRPTYIVLAIIVALIFNALIRNYQFLTFVFGSGFFDSTAKLKMTWAVLTSVNLNLAAPSAVSVIILSILAGINIAFFIFYFNQRRAVSSSAVGISTLGIIGEFLGVGCIACGSVILSFFFGFTATTVLIGFLPLKGFEFTLIGIFLLLFSIYLIALKIQAPIVCKKPSFIKRTK